jgi:hypothetical protein
MNRLGTVRNYWGYDVHRPSVEWCHDNITKRDSAYQFLHLDIQSQRYNADGKPLEGTFRFPCRDACVDVLIACSLFSHLMEHELPIYFREIRRVLSPDGKAYLTGFLEEGVPNMSVNPPGYRLSNWDGEIHCVRYNKDYFKSLLQEHGLFMWRFDYEEYFDGESAIYVKRRLDSQSKDWSIDPVGSSATGSRHTLPSSTAASR